MQHFSWYSLIPGYEHLNHWLIQAGILKEGHSAQHLVSATLVFIFILVVAFLVKRRYADPKANLIPSRRFGLIPLLEVIIEWLRTLINETIGHGAERHAPILIGTFLFIFFSNLMGIIPGFPPPTTTIATNLAMAGIIFLYYNYSGFREHGIGYLKQLAGPVVWLAWMMIPIELISHIVRPISLSLRLAGNMTGDHAVLSMFTDMTYVGVPMLFIGLGIFVSFIQAFVFTLLSMIYISMAVSHDH
jgi:F-type H+-transporting ATPase subunit a